MGFMESLSLGVVALIIIIIAGICLLFIKVYRKVPQGTALIINGLRTTRASFTGALVYPFINKAEEIDITVKRIQIERMGSEGLVCKDNMRADIKVAFFVKVNPTPEDVMRVAVTLGVKRASDIKALVEHFDAKFSEALKTAGKKFDFVELYEARAQFKEEVTEVIGRELDGYVLDDCAIDYLEQTSIGDLSPDNILDSEGIKKITELTSQQKILANQIDREREKTIKRQNVEAEEAVLEMDRQLSESQERQKREVTTIKARETAETHKIQQEERLRAEQARIATEEQLAVLEQNKQRQVIVAEKNKQRTDAVESERIEKDRLLEQTERERVVDLARIEKERALEVERKNIQDVIRERVAVEKTVVEEEEKIKDTRAVAEAQRLKSVAVITAEKEAEETLVKVVKTAQAERDSAELKAQQKLIDAEAEQKAADKSAEARKVLAEAMAAEEASRGMAEVRVQEARALAREKEGDAEAHVAEKMALAQAKGLEVHADALKKQGVIEAEVLEQKALAEARGREAAAEAHKKQGLVEAEILEQKALAEARGGEAAAAVREKEGAAEAAVREMNALAEAKGLLAKADALKKQGTIEAEILEQKALAEARGAEAAAHALEIRGAAEAANMRERFKADAEGIREKAEAMKGFDAEGRAHEEFKLLTEKDVRLALAQIENQRHIADAQAKVLAEALKTAKIDIVGGDNVFFDKLMGAVTQSRYVDRLVGDSKVLSEVKNTFFNGDPDYFKSQLNRLIDQFGLTSEDVKNLTVSAALGKMMQTAGDDKTRGILGSIMNFAEKFGLHDTHLKDFGK